MSLPVCTIVSNNYLALAGVLAESYREHHPGAEVFVCVVDRPAPEVRYDELPFRCLFVEELGLEGFAPLAFRYGLLELNTAVKPFLLEHLHKHHGLTRVFYLDPDILVLDRLSGLEQALERGPLVLTPHITAPLDDDRRPSERLVLQCGVYNLGFLGLRLDEQTLPFLRWWQDRLRRFCLHDPEHGLFVDQSWMDLAPALLPDVQVMRDPVYNVAYWNLSQRRPLLVDGRWRIDGRPLGFFHFSGLTFDDLDAVSRYQDRVHLSQRPELRPLFASYRARVWAAGHERWRGLPYAFGRLSDGRSVPPLARRVLARVDPEGRRWRDPFAAGPDGFAAWLCEPLRFEGGLLTRLALALWEERPDLAGRFADVCGADLAGFREWLAGAEGETQTGLDAEWLALALPSPAGEAGPSGPPGDAGAAGGPTSAAGSVGGAPVSGLLGRTDLSRPGALTPWLNEPLGLPGERPVVTRAALHVHGLRADVQRRYPNPLGSDRAAFAYWFAVIGADEQGLAESLVVPVRRSLGLRSRLSLAVRRARRRRAAARRERLRGRPQPTVRACAAAPPPAGVNLLAPLEAPDALGQQARALRAALQAGGVAHTCWSLDRAAPLDLAQGRLEAPAGLPYAVTLLLAETLRWTEALARVPAVVRAGGRLVACWPAGALPAAGADASALARCDEIWLPAGTAPPWPRLAGRCHAVPWPAADAAAVLARVQRLLQQVGAR